MINFKKKICKVLSLIAVSVITLGSISAEAVICDWPGCIDVVPGMAVTEYFPEIETVDHYDEYGTACDANGWYINGWYYDPEQDLYIRNGYENNGWQQKENPYADVGNLAMGTVEMYLNYDVKFPDAVLPDSAQVAVYIFSEDYQIYYRIRVDYGVNGYSCQLPVGKYSVYDIQTYDSVMSVGCNSRTTDFYLTADSPSHVECELVVGFNESLHELEAIAASENGGVDEVPSQSIEAVQQAASTEAQQTIQTSSAAAAVSQSASGASESTASGLLSSLSMTSAASQNSSYGTTEILVAVLIGSVIFLAGTIVVAIIIFVRRGRRQ